MTARIGPQFYYCHPRAMRSAESPRLDLSEVMHLKSYISRVMPVCALAVLSLHAQQPSERINGHDAITGEFIVKFKTSDALSRNAIQALTNAASPARLSRFDEVYLFHSRSHTGLEALALIKARAEIQYAE